MHSRHHHRGGYGDQHAYVEGGAHHGHRAAVRGASEKKKLLKKITHIEEVYEETEKNYHDAQSAAVGGRHGAQLARSHGGYHSGGGRRLRYPHPHRRFRGPPLDRDWDDDYYDDIVPIRRPGYVARDAIPITPPGVGCSCADCARTRVY